MENGGRSRTAAAAPVKRSPENTRRESKLVEIGDVTVGPIFEGVHCAHVQHHQSLRRHVVTEISTVEADRLRFPRALRLIAEAL